MRSALVAVVAGGLTLVAIAPRSLFAQEAVVVQPAAAPPADMFAGPWPRELLTAEQADRLVGPVALYPDPLLAQVLPASTYPVEIVKAARLVRAGADEAAIVATNLDPSVQALARYPEVVLMMDEHLEWTERLGQAFLEQPDDVMLAVQRMRALAKEFGNLATTPQQEVVIEREVIRIVPVTEYVYVPYYQPSVVYSTRCVPSYSYVTFRSCSWVGSWYNLDCDWNRRRVCRHDGWTWRDYCHRRSAWTGLTISFNLFGDDCERPRSDWCRDPHRRGHPGGGRRDFARDRDRRDHGEERVALATPRAPAPRPPTVNVPRPAPREDAGSPNPPRRPAEIDRTPREPRPEPKAPEVRPDRKPGVAEVPSRPRPEVTPAPKPEVKLPVDVPRPERPVAKPVPQPDRPEAKPNVKPGTKPVTKPNVQPEGKPRPIVKPESKPETQLPTSKPVAKPQEPESRPVIKPTRPEPTRPAKPEVPAAKPDSKPIATPKPAPATKPETPAARPAPKPEPQPAPVSRPMPKPEAPIVRPAPKPSAAPAQAPKQVAKPASTPPPAAKGSPNSVPAREEKQGKSR